MTDPRFRRLRDRLFDRSLPRGALRGALPEEKAVSVRMLSDGAGTLFVTGRFDSLSGSGLVLYHSGTGEIFATRTLSVGDAYTFQGIPILGSDPEVQRLARIAEQQTVETPDLSAFLNLPDSVESQVYRLAAAAAAGADTAAEKADRLAKWLSATYPYSLLQNTPPADREFVSWFLLSEQRGSCTSFAAALVVLSRCIGLPARYCEGFSVSPAPDGIAILTGFDAHAWAEIYLPGLGWTPFDATPADRAREDTARAPASPAAEEPPSRRETFDDPGLPDSAEPAGSEILPADPKAVSFPGALEESLHILLGLLPALIFLLALFPAAGMRIVSPERQAKHASPRRGIRIWYSACRSLLTAGGLAPNPGEAPGSYLVRADLVFPGVGLSALSGMVNGAFYGKRAPTREDAASARRIYQTLRRRLPLRVRVHAAASRLRDALSPRRHGRNFS